MPIAICTISSACGWYMKVPELLHRRTRRRRSCRRGMCGCVRPPTPSMPFGSRMPCQWIVVCSGSLLVTKMRTRSPSTHSMVGPGRLAVVAPQVAPSCRARARARTGSATRWNSLPAVVHAPRQRPAVQRDDRVVGPAGRRGRAAAASSASSAIGASGSEAAPTRLTAAAPSSRRRRPPEEISSIGHVGVLSVRRRRRRGGRGGAPRGRAAPGRAAGERGLQVGLGDPEVAQRLDRRR